MSAGETPELPRQKAGLCKPERKIFIDIGAHHDIRVDTFSQGDARTSLLLALIMPLMVAVGKAGS
jgi:hypothetical protein